LNINSYVIAVLIGVVGAFVLAAFITLLS